MIKFGMGNMLLTFVDKHYQYSGDENVEERGLTIDGYESAWLADLVVAYILECAETSFMMLSTKISTEMMVLWYLRMSGRKAMWQNG